MSTNIFKQHWSDAGIRRASKRAASAIREKLKQDKRKESVALLKLLF